VPARSFGGRQSPSCKQDPAAPPSARLWPFCVERPTTNPTRWRSAAGLSRGSQVNYRTRLPWRERDISLRVGDEAPSVLQRNKWGGIQPDAAQIVPLTSLKTSRSRHAGWPHKRTPDVLPCAQGGAAGYLDLVDQPLVPSRRVRPISRLQPRREKHDSADVMELLRFGARAAHGPQTRKGRRSPRRPSSSSTRTRRDHTSGMGTGFSPE
jgi:hypothetical protein